MSKKTAIEECIEMSTRLDFMHWFNANKEHLLKLEKEQRKNKCTDITEATHMGTNCNNKL